MGKRRHILPAALIAALSAPLTAGAEMPDDPLLFFAHCTGRLSAELSHHWMLASPHADEIEEMRAALIDILDMMTPEGAGRDVLNWRIDARAAHAALLTRATFSQDSWARDRAAAEIAQCAAFVLGPPEPTPGTPTPDATLAASQQFR